jgi:hypothetical protein
LVDYQDFNSCFTGHNFEAQLRDGSGEDSLPPYVAHRFREFSRQAGFIDHRPVTQIGQDIGQ